MVGRHGGNLHSYQTDPVLWVLFLLWKSAALSMRGCCPAAHVRCCMQRGSFLEHSCIWSCLQQGTGKHSSLLQVTSDRAMLHGSSGLYFCPFSFASKVMNTRLFFQMSAMPNDYSPARLQLFSSWITSQPAIVSSEMEASVHTNWGVGTN